MHANVNHYPASAHQLAAQQPKAVFRTIDKSQFVHQPFGVQCPALTIAVIPYGQPVSAGQFIAQAHLYTNLQMVSGETFVIGRRHFVKQRVDAGIGGLCIPDAAGTGKIFRRLNVVSP